MVVVDVTEEPSLVAKGLLAALPRRVAAPEARIGIVCMTKRPLDLLTWLTYHREVCGVRRFYLRVEDTPGASDVLGAAPWVDCVEVEYGTGERDYFRQMDRQNRHVDAVVPRARAAGLCFLLHIDDDELLYCAGGVAGLHVALANAPASTGNLQVDNLEALPPHAHCSNPFAEVTAFRHNTSDFCAYANGKSFGRLGDPTLRASGPHRFSCFPSKTHQLPPTAAVVLHYESANAKVWHDKYAALSRQHAGSRAVREQAPTLFYDESMRAIGAVVAAEASGELDVLEAAKASAMGLYAKWKLLRTPLPPPPSEGRPRHLPREGVTLIDALGQPRVGALDLDRAACAAPPPPLSPLPLPPPARPPSKHAGWPGGTGDRCELDGETAEVRRLEGLLREATIGDWATHARALHAAVDRRVYVDEIAKVTGLSLGARLRLRGAVLRG